MKMKRLLTLFLAFTVAFLISSCATIHPNQKLLIGTWNPEQFEKHHLSNYQNPAAAGSQGKTKSGTGETKPSAVTAEQSSKAKEQISILIQTELKSSMTLKADKTAIMVNDGKTVHATWKLKNNGTRLLLSSRETGKKTTLDILHINDSSAVMTKSFPICSLKITYKKVRK